MTALLLATLVACSPTGKDTATAAHHPDGFAAPTVHGVAAKSQAEPCVDCHGADLAGEGAAVSCDTCHPVGWRTDCTFCHGGTNEPSGAPPRDLDGADTDISFAAHTAHVTTNLHGAYDCVQCHTRPADALSEGHVFHGDATPSVAEVAFGGGISPAAVYAGSGTCSNLYCHGSGQGSDGTAAVGQTFAACDDCHASAESDGAAWAGMSGDHERHLDEGLACAECHSATLDASGALADAPRHVDGIADVALPEGMDWLPTRQCEGSCHGEGHGGRTW